MAERDGRLFQVLPRDGSDHRRYAPHRDIAHHGIQTIQRTIDSLVERKESWLRELCVEYDVSDEALGLAAQRLAEFLNYVPKVEYQDLGEIAELVKLDEVDPLALSAIFAKLGEMQFAAIFIGLRDITAANGAIPDGVDGVIRAGDQLAEGFKSYRWLIVMRKIKKFIVDLIIRVVLYFRGIKKDDC